ncbi:PREDICTED: mitotic spindle checkpoint protein MAD1 isoform X1 [Nicotiana attenuata]|uniref:mitotic spindle checkpoint protein MAD1 isoform X1 n=1 Tax=Nicotiana attenuata TaxID=49451 RepID=UPI0009047A85|nr:PREDICTED: mitotic spindle checkpoint protein MAD1 isoform X1 [Nicotiana attenuata]
MMLRTPPLKRRAQSKQPEDGSPNSGNRQLIIYEDTPLPESSHDHPETSDQMLCTYQCRQMVKSEFFDALSSAEKQARDSQSKLETLNNDYLKADAERKKFRDQFLNSEQELAAARGREEALQDQLLKEVNASQERLRKQLQLYSELEGKFQHEVNLRKKAETSAAASEEKASLLERKLSSVSESIKREKSRLQNDLEQLKSESKFSVTKISKNLERMEFRAANAEKESVLLKEQLEELRKRLDECVQQRIEAEKKLSNFTFQEGCSSDNILVKHLQDELRNCEAEVREARKLRSSHENIELLKVKLLEEKGRRDRAESELLKLADLQGDMKKLEDELTTWKSMVKDIPGVSCADDVPPKFAALQREVLDSMTKVGEVQARLKQMEVALDTAELEKRKAESEAAVAKESADSSKSEIKRIELKLVAVIEEKDRLKNVVEDLRKQKSVESGHEVVSGAILQGLEASLAKKEDAIKELESSLSEQKEVNIRQLNEINLLSEKLNNEARRIRSLEREGDRLRSEIALLESKLGHGDYSSANTKVLRMVNTLGVENEAKQTIEALQNELQKTKEKLLAIQELKEQSADAGTLVDSYISGKIMQLKEQIATLEKREERYKTVFADRISVFRRACCELFGYKIVMDDHHRPDGIPVTRFMLQSIYAQSDNEKLEFEYESGNTNILANTYTSQPEISRQVDIFIRKMNSIPAFTANLTVESFNKRTLS